MLWNLFLAYIPFLISKYIPIQPKIYLEIWLPVWLIFLPNAPYLLTDIFHLQKGTAMPMWYDLLLLITFSVNGMFLYFISLKKMHELIKTKYSVKTANIIIYTSIILSSFGVYLGRYLRWNSWEIIQQPFAIIQDVLHRLIYPNMHTRTWGVTIGYSILFGMIFWFLNNIKISTTFVKKELKK
jgi:uncharacterized membrane protein